MVVGPRFSAFWPVGLKAVLEYEWLFLAEAYGWSYEQVMAIPVSRRNKAVKFREEVVRQRNANVSRGATVGASAPKTWYQRQMASHQSQDE